jgi:hypothetical protein
MWKKNKLKRLNREFQAILGTYATEVVGNFNFSLVATKRRLNCPNYLKIN